MQNAWVLNQEILINPELYHPWVTLCLHAYLNFINCDLYAAYRWLLIGNKLYSILFYASSHGAFDWSVIVYSLSYPLAI